MVVQEIITIVSNNVSTQEYTRTKYIIGRPLTDILRSLGTVGSPPPSPVGSVRVLCGSHAEYSPSAFCDPSQSSDSGGRVSASQHDGSGVQPKRAAPFLASWACAKATFRCLSATADTSKTAIITLFDLFEFDGMPFCLRHADMTFQGYQFPSPSTTLQFTWPALVGGSMGPFPGFASRPTPGGGGV